MPSAISEHTFADPAGLAAALAASVADALRAAIDARSGALLALSGGTTPELFLRCLGQQQLEWNRVTVTLCDERWVPPQHERSNARLVARTLLRGAASAARFVPLYAERPDPEKGAAVIDARIAALPLPLDVAVLGMGNDGHTASFFPGGDHLDEALDPRGTRLVSPMRAPAAGEPRITLTLPLLAAARHVYLHIEGAAKQAVFARVVRGDGEFAGSPMRAVIEHARVPVAVYWCP